MLISNSCFEYIIFLGNIGHYALGFHLGSIIRGLSSLVNLGLTSWLLRRLEKNKVQPIKLTFENKSIFEGESLEKEQRKMAQNKG